MFDTRSVYALNKLDKTAIVYPSVTGEDTRLERKDFASEEKFEYWKNWSDDNYHKAETDGWNDSRCLSFEAQKDAPVPSAEDIVLASYITAEQTEWQREVLEQIRKYLTEKQYRRWWQYYIKKIPDFGYSYSRLPAYPLGLTGNMKQLSCQPVIFSSIPTADKYRSGTRQKAGYSMDVPGLLLCRILGKAVCPCGCRGPPDLHFNFSPVGPYK